MSNPDFGIAFNATHQVGANGKRASILRTSDASSAHDIEQTIGSRASLLANRTDAAATEFLRHMSNTIDTVSSVYVASDVLAKQQQASTGRPIPKTKAVAAIDSKFG